ncbi:MAG: (d)CMP kinase [Firmicutes bacterium]|nr:(d)CMP kinase [Bacillota bacterium]
MLRVAIDGPGGAGKSTIAKILAKELGLDYIDTGAMYRAVALKMTRLGVPAEEDQVAEALTDTTIDFAGGSIYLDGQEVNEAIRTPEMGGLASLYSALGCVRKKLVERQKEMGQTKDCIMDGRDIGTNVLPNAEFKFFLTASAEERARRRYKELIEKGQDVEYEKILADINERDYNDSHRALDPLRKAEDAIEVDTTHMTIDEVIATLVGIIHGENK